MVKYLSRANTVLYTFLIGFTIWYVGHELDEYLIDVSKKYEGITVLLANLNVFQYAISCLLFLVTSVFLAKEVHYSKQYYLSAIIPVVSYGFVWGIVFKYYNPKYPFGLAGNDSFLDCRVVPGVLLTVTAIIAINYILCGIKAKKELGF